MPDTTGHDPPQRDELHTMTLRELEAKIIAAGILMSRRQIMRHCQGGTFDAKKLPATNNLDEWFIAPASIGKGIADIKTLQEHRARRVTSRLDMTGYDGQETPTFSETDTTGHDASRQVMSEKENINEKGETHSDMTRHVASDFDIFGHPYVKRLEKQIEDKDKKYDAHVRRTEELLMQSQQQLVQLQSLVQVGQSETLADFMLKAKDFLLGRGEIQKREVEDPSIPQTHHTSA